MTALLSSYIFCQLSLLQKCWAIDVRLSPCCTSYHMPGVEGQLTLVFAQDESNLGCYQ